MDLVDPEHVAAAGDVGRPMGSSVLRDVRERLAELEGAAPERLVVGVWHSGDGVFVVALAGEMDLANAAELGHALDDMTGPAPCRMVIELSALTFIDSTGIREIVRAHSALSANGGTIVLVAASANVAQVLDLANLAGVAGVKIEASLEAALGLGGEAPKRRRRLDGGERVERRSGCER